MDRLVFTSHMAQREYRLDRQVLTHELANVSTVGFKKALSTANLAVKVAGDGFDSRFLPRAFTQNIVDLTEGERIVTGRPLDIAMNRQTVLGVQADNGDLAFTRRGDLQTTADGLLQLADGSPVLDDSGAPISVPTGVALSIRSDGLVMARDPNNSAAPDIEVAQLMLRDASQTTLMRREDGLFQPVPTVDADGNPVDLEQRAQLFADGFPAQDFESGPEAPSVSSGTLEGSNVSTVETLVKFIDHMRNFEMQTKVIKEMKDNDSSGASMMRLS